MSQKYNIANERPAISKSEIDGYKNFDLLLKKQSESITNKTNGSWVKGLVLGVVGGVMLYFLFSLTKGENVKKGSDKKENLVVMTEGIKEKQQEVLKVEDKKKELTLVEKAPLTKTKQYKKTVKEEESSNNQQNSSEVANYNYIEASPIDGLQQLYKYFDGELTYPPAVLKDSIEGTVLISFTVGKEGEVKKIEVIQSLSEALDNEAIRVIKNMPSWSAATVNEEPVESKLSIPLSFNIKNK